MLEMCDLEDIQKMMQLEGQRQRTALQSDLRAFADELSRLLEPVYSGVEKQHKGLRGVCEAVEELVKGMREFVDSLPDGDPSDWWREGREDGQ